MIVDNIFVFFTVILIASMFQAEYGFLKPIQALQKKNQPLKDPPQCFYDCAEAVFPCEARDSLCMCEFVVMGVVEIMDRCIDSICEGSDKSTSLNWMNSTCDEQLGTLESRKLTQFSLVPSLIGCCSNTINERRTSSSVC
jgi:hypothetical protein